MSGTGPCAGLATHLARLPFSALKQESRFQTRATESAVSPSQSSAVQFYCVAALRRGNGPGETLTILFIDDDPFQAMVYTAALEGRFLQVRRVADPAEALCLVEDPRIASHLDLVISAHQPPGMTGPDFVSELHRRLPSIPVLVLGAGQEMVEDYPASGGLVVFLHTPVTAKRLVETVRQILARGFCNVA